MSPAASYGDPVVAADSHDALNAMVVGVLQQFPGHRSRLIGSVDVHHDRAGRSRELAGPDGAPRGGVRVDFAVLTADGRRRAIARCIEPPGSAA